MTKKKRLLSKAEWNCANKDAYRSERIAGIRAQQLTEKRGVYLYPYQCKECKQWHLTRRVQHTAQAVMNTKPTVEGFTKEPDA